ncbi:MAG: GTP 3',8-cyclase MoaA [Burkholderiales bacterium]|nr:MAG: GTP 3',8-cyclase MoaA [Burkholderiales bacterium]
MSDRIIPLAEARYVAPVPQVPRHPTAPSGRITDMRGRRLHDLRISVTDRCNFRCTYCMPSAIFDKDYVFLPQSSLLTFEELERVVRLFVAHGVEKVRLTGGEPLLRRHVERLIERLARIERPDGKPLDLTLTTNGSLLARKAEALASAGLRRATVSLDAIDERVFQQMNDVDFPVSDVLDGIAAAERAGLASIKINMVVKRGVNDAEILPMARHFRGTGHIVRFIEFMDVGASNGWRMDDVVPCREVLDIIGREFPLEAVGANYEGEVAERWRYRDGRGEIGVIGSVTQPFCAGCTRMRLSTEGKLFTCLFASDGRDLRALLRGGYSDAEISGAIGLIWQRRGDRYSEIRSSQTVGLRKIEMSYIGG